MVQVSEVSDSNKEQLEMNHTPKTPSKVKLDSSKNTSKKINQQNGEVNLGFENDNGDQHSYSYSLQEKVSKEKVTSLMEKVEDNDENETSSITSEPSLISKSERKFSIREDCKFVKARRLQLKELRRYLGFDDDGTGRSILVIEEKIRVDIFVKLFNTLDILDKLFRLFDYYQEGKLNQDTWIELLKTGLNQIAAEDEFKSSSNSNQNSERKVDFVEVVESVAYAVCGNSDVTFEQFCVIFRTKNVLNKFFSLIDHDYDGVITAEQIMDFISQLTGAKSGSRLTKENIVWLENLFRQYVGDDKEIKKEVFSKIIQTKNQFFTDRIFDILDGDASGTISLQEFLDATHKFAGENPEDKILFLFKVYDVDGDGLIQEKELEQVMRACMEENNMNFSDEQIRELTKALFDDADVEGRGTLTYDALKGQLEKHGGLLENLSISIERWLVPPKPKANEMEISLCEKIRKLKPHKMSRRYIRNNYVFLLWLIGFLAANLALFVTRAVVFRRHHPNATDYLVIARAAGQCLNFDCVFIVIVMLRQSLTFLRSRGASSYVPIDQHFYFHKRTGQFIFFFSFLHTAMHLINIEVGLVHNSLKNTSNFTYTDYLFNPKATKSLGLIPGSAVYTGLILMAILIIMVICSLPFVRRGGSFEIFYWTHLLYIPFYILLIIHAPHFWQWFLVPGIIFIIEQAIRIFYWRVGKGKSYITSGILLPSKVTHLIIKKPANFDFNPGDYVFVRIPRIAKYEWHPFTISSSPEQEDVLWLHIRAVGEWTNRLYNYFEKEQNKAKTVAGNASNAFFKLPGMNRRSKIIRKRIEVNYNSPGNNIRRSITPMVVLDETTNRMQLKSVADSNSSVSPGSEHSAAASASENSIADVLSSGDMIDDNNPTIPNETINNSGYQFGRRPELLSINSMPNVHEGVTERERKSYLREVVRSGSVACDEISLSHHKRDSIQSVKNQFEGRRRRTISNPAISGSVSALSSLRYMRNKPKIISLNTPKSAEESELKEGLLGEEHVIRQKRSGSCMSEIRLAEEGKSRAVVSFNNNDDIIKNSDYNSTSFSNEADLAEADEDDLIVCQNEQCFIAGQALEIYVDGPYGAPSSHIFRAQHAVLIATGIGVTPFASILQSIMRRYWASRNTCPNCTFTWCSDLPQSVLNLRKVDFFWINRDQRSFEWFVHLLSQLEIEQAELGGAMERFLDMHMYITSALQRTDMKAVGLQLALDLLHEKEKRDLITGLKTRTNAGRPNWNKIFQQLKDQQKGKVTVFYCGPPELARTLKMKCDEFDFSFRKELF